MKFGESVFLSVVVGAAILCLHGQPASAQAVGTDRSVQPATPFISYVIPAAGSGSQAEFRFGYHDSVDAENLRLLDVMFVAVNRDDPAALFVRVEPLNGQVLVGTHGRFGGPYQYGRLGENRTISNTYANIDLSRMSVVQLNATDYELRMHLNFIDSVWDDRQVNIIMHAEDIQTIGTDYGQLGTFRIDKPSGDHTPENVSVSPRNDNGRVKTFTFVGKDEDGADDINYIEGAFGRDGGSWLYSVAIGAMPGTGRYRLIGFGESQEGTIGSSLLQNPYVQVLSTSLEKGRENERWIFTVRLKFTPRFQGEFVVTMYTRDRSNRSDYDNMTRFTSTRSGHTPRALFIVPGDVTVSALESPGLPIPVNFYSVWSDQDGRDDIERLEVKIADSPGDTDDIALIRVKPNDGMVDIRSNESDADNIETPIGTHADLDVATMQLPADRVNVTAIAQTQFSISFFCHFKELMQGSKNVYARGIDFGGLRGGWRKIGTINIANGNFAPRPESVTPGFSFGSHGSLALKFRDADGVNDIETAEVIFNTGGSAQAAGGVHLVYNHRSRILAVRQDGSSASGSIDNPNLDLGFSRATVDFRRSFVLAQGNLLSLFVTISFDPEVFSGAKTIWLRCTDTRGRTSRWRALGGFVIE